MTGISNFNIKAFHINVFDKSNFELSIPKLEFSIFYGAYGSVGDLINLNCHKQEMK